MRRFCTIGTLVLSFLCHAGSAATASTSGYWNAIWEQKVKDYKDREAASRTQFDGYDWRYKDRVQVDADAVEYVRRLTTSGVVFFAPDLADYLQQRLLAVHPERLPEGHPGALSIRLVQSPDPNAAALSDGTIILNTGLVSFARTEDELAAIIAHEVGHVVLDHNMESISAARDRVALTAMFGVLAGAVVGAIAANSNDPTTRYYAPDMAMLGFLTAAALSQATLDLLGAKYSRDQEKAADRVAQGWLRAAGRDTLAYARVLARLGEWGRIRGAGPRASLADDHPAVVQRLKALKLPVRDDPVADRHYDGRVASCLSRNAKLAMYAGRYVDALGLCDRVIDSGWSDGETLVLRAAAIRNLSADADSLPAALALLDRAERVYGYSSAGLHVERALLELRLNNEASALYALKQAETDLKVERGEERAELQDWIERTTTRLVARAK
jgi:Zn-dependent protease with chaperone function